MRKKIHIIVGIIILAVLAAVGVTAVNYKRSQEVSKPVAELIFMPDAVLPVVSFYYENNMINETWGYGEALNMNLVRGNVTPVGEDKTVPAVITLRESDVTAISFQIRSLGDGRLLEDTKVEEWSRNENQIRVELSLSTLVQLETEYLLDLILTTETHGEIHYYTRIQCGAQKSILELLDFAENFSRASFEKDQSVLVPYMQSKTPKTEDNLAYVDLNSRYALLTWGNYGPVRTADYKISVKELGEEQISLNLEYPVEITEEDGTFSSYSVKEFYCLRMRSNQVYILNYYRTMEENLQPEQITVDHGQINLGMSADIPYTASSTKGEYTAFIYGKGLWLYEKETQDIQLLYSDAATGNKSYDIQIASVQEDGTVAFAVYGYIGRGEFEGTHKLCWYEYKKETNALTRKLYIPLTRTYEFLEGEQALSVYGNQAGEYYIRLDEGIYCIKPDTEEIVTISDQVREDAFLQDVGGNILAWQEGETEPICVLNMDTGVVNKVEAEAGQFVSMEGLNGNDLVYGKGNLSDTGTLEDGTAIKPLYALMIMNAEGEELHRYEKEGYYISRTSIEPGRIVMERVQKTGENTYRQVERDTLLSSGTEETDLQATVSAVGSGSYRKDTILRIADAPSGSASAKGGLPLLSQEPSLEIMLDNQNILAGKYQVYAKGGLMLETDNLIEAIQTAFDEAGAVTGENLFLYWFRSSRKNYVLLPYENRSSGSAETNLVNCMEVMTQVIGKNPESVGDAWKENASVVQTLETVLGKEIISLQGSAIAQVLYYLDEKSPVLIQTGNQSAVLLVGYSGNNVMLYDGSGELRTMTQADLQALTESTKAPMYAYVKRSE